MSLVKYIGLSIILPGYTLSDFIFWRFHPTWVHFVPAANSGFSLPVTPLNAR